MTLRVVCTTDGQYLGELVDVPFADLAGRDVPMGPGIAFSIVNYAYLGDNKHIYSNAHYVAICEEV